MSEGASKVQTIVESEVNFLKENLDCIVNIDKEYCIGYIDANSKSDLDDLLERFFLVNSTSFVHNEVHSKDKGHKRFSQKVKKI
ncbi:hypothetical protein AC249_AIPGENE11448 [Exaiptasia diaphana]|nr:hypothetical protein AC249_AIPGENE11448 [Exaiptasia diaphana]